MTRKKSPDNPDPAPDDDGAEFRKAVADAKPLQRDFVEIVRRRPAPRARFRRRDEREALAESLDAEFDDIEANSGDKLQFRRPEIGQRTLRQLARGRFSVQAALDLHGMTATEAESALRAFVDASLDAGHRCVRVVHGKGLGSGSGGPVLKPRVNRWLRRWREVLAFTSARQVDGGTGATYVLLSARGDSSGTT